MNNRGQMVILGVFVAVLIGLALILPVFSFVGQSTNLVIITNQTLTLGAVDAAVNLEGRAVSGFEAYNSTGGAVIADTNYTTSNDQVVNGELTAIVTTDTGAQYAGAPVNLTYTSTPAAYPASGGTRAVIGLVAIFAALMIVVVAIPDMRELFGMK